MRQDVEFDAEGVTLRGWLYVPDGAEDRAPAVVMAHGFSAVKEMYLDRFAEVFAAAGPGGAGVRQPQLRRQRRASRARRSTRGAGPRLPARDHLRRRRARGRRGAHRRLGLELLGRTCARRGRDRSPGAVRGLAGPAHQRACELPRARARRLHRGLPGAVRRRPRGPLPRRAAGDVAGRSGGPARASALPTPTPGPWFTETGRPGHRRGATRSRCAAWRCSPSTSPALPPLDQPDAADDGRRRATITSRRPTSPSRPTSAQTSPSGWLLPAGHFDAYVDGFDAASGAAREWFVEHLRPAGRRATRFTRQGTTAEVAEATP